MTSEQLEQFLYESLLLIINELYKENFNREECSQLASKAVTAYLSMKKGY